MKQGITKNIEGFTGLEAAIVLIAFVVVAAVFSYVLLGAGFFTTQKSQEVVYSSVGQASSAIILLGDVYGSDSRFSIDDDSSSGMMDSVIAVVGLSAGNTPVDIKKTTVTFSNSHEIMDLEFNSSATGQRMPVKSGEWTVYSIMEGSDDLLLESCEQICLLMEVGDKIHPNERFKLSLAPPEGTPLVIDRKAPPKINTINVLN
ncbi:flagellin [Methanoplanus sp. FWC-SCC4]|uniref:Flagellin n=1 Tax=Methanochimaera problematica TaxID=2609417 RepID=A0AA97FF67_9EURY|nr:archaellin/type IV pilin N-terminal domain-containing protein [Methanoplanus sp. FWC-SCC4]WOF17074.1 flagellin [Methanoplanus sp. FWC-SCC4]